VSHVISVEVNDETFRGLTHRAKVAGDSPSRIATRLLESYCAPGTLQPSETGQENSFEALFGSLDLGHPTGTDNKGIDEDLAKAYGA